MLHRAFTGRLPALAGLLAVMLAAQHATVAASARLRVESAEAGDPLAPRGRSFEVVSKPADLEFGQVFNDLQQPVPLPPHVRQELAKGDHVITAFQADVVEFSESGKVLGSVPLYDSYLHHYGAFIGDKEHLQHFYDMLHNTTSELGKSDGLGLGLDLAYGGGTGAMPMRELEATFREFGKKAGKKNGFIGGGSGAEERGTKHVYPAPYGLVIAAGTDALMPLMHLIHTRGDVEPGTRYSPMAECTCSSDRDIDPAAGTIDGKKPLIPFRCNEQLLLEHNSGCSLETYRNGFRCCDHMVYVSEPDARAGHAAARFGMKFTFWYEAAQPDVVALRGAACCDATGSLSGSGQIEYDIPRCAEGDEECVHTLVSYQYLDVPTRSSFNPSPSQGLSPEEKADIDAGREVELVYVVGHQHLGAAPTGIKLFKDSTDELICESKPIMGQGTAPGDEKGYVVGMEPCIWGGDRTPPRLRRDAVVRVESTYNSTEPHYGVMSLFLMQVADVPLPSEAILKFE
mmetsp:Transcript_35197/g.88685  ORF Transcript_35197/g.88685 Transcript_35197/m.88685 type:complete len:514 (+) Transcript_35197:263-1804(+)|eukprot:jgi/Tetstr1/446681/TSEL_003620.t1